MNKADQKVANERLVKFKSVMKANDEGKLYMVGVALRADGRLEFYSDFMLVEEYFNPYKPCDDIDCDFDLFYYKFKILNAKGQEVGYEYRKGVQEWRNRIGIYTSKVFKDAKKFDIICHRRIAKYFNIYSGIINFQTFMLVSHRNHISVFDMAKTEWVKGVMFSFGKTDFIRLLAVKKKPKGDRYRRRQQ